ncbi:MAG: hypothetical protein QXL57_02810 [Candidatus Bathyarchaeia archaeon]
MRANLERIRKGEIEEWLVKSEEKYKCPICGKPLSTGAIKRKCYHCGADLYERKLQAKDIFIDAVRKSLQIV